MGLLYTIGIRLVNFIVFFLVIVLMPGLPPKTTFKFEAFNVTRPRELKGSLDSNNYLDKTERLFEGRLYGPEHLIVRNNEIFTGIHGGEIVKINGDHITHVTKFGKPCDPDYEEEICGRPLGFAFDPLNENQLIVADAYYGIFEVDIKSGKKNLLISPTKVLEGKVNRPAKIFNSVAVAKNGDIYWTDSSSEHGLNDGTYTLFENPHGRLFHYNRATKVNRVLIDQLYFANGVALSPNEDFVVVAETGASQLKKHHLTGPKAGKTEVFIDGLPGFVDNLTPDANGIWLPLVVAVDKDHPSLPQALTRLPYIRLFLARILALIELPFKVINNALPNIYCKRALHFIGHLESVNFLYPPRVSIVRLDWNGGIVGAIHGFDQSISGISHVLEHNDYLYLGSPFNKYLGRTKVPRRTITTNENLKIEIIPEDGGAPIPAQGKIEIRQNPTTTQPPTTTTTTTTPKPTTQKQTTTTTTTPKPTTTTTSTTTTTTTPKPTTTTTTTPKPTTTTTPKPTTTTSKPTTTQKPTTAPPPPTTAQPKTQPPPPPSSAKPTEAPKPAPAPTVKPVETAKQAPPPPTDQKTVPDKPAPIHENIPKDTPTTPPPKLKIIKKGGEQGEF